MGNSMLLDATAIRAVKDLTLTISALSFEMSLANNLAVKDRREAKVITREREELQRQLNKMSELFNKQLEEFLANGATNGNNDTTTS